MIVLAETGKRQREQAYYDSARSMLETKIQERPDDPRYRSALGIAYAGLGRKEEAIREGEAGLVARHLDEQDNLDFFKEKYARPRSDARRQVERAVFGDEVGLTGYTTVEQAQALVDHLSLLPTTRLLDVGAGHGWPGSYLARSSGCSLVATDIPLDALRAAKGYLEQASAVSADGCALPFRSGSFDGVVHADVFC